MAWIVAHAGPSESWEFEPLVQEVLALSARMSGSSIGAPALTRTYAYDGDGLLRSRTAAALTTTYLWTPREPARRPCPLGPEEGRS